MPISFVLFAFVLDYLGLNSFFSAIQIGKKNFILSTIKL